MKIEPVKNYKKPNYAMRIASILTAAGSLAGCSTTTQLDGDVSVADTEPTTSVTDVELMGMIEPVEETCVTLDGDVTAPADTEPFLDGDVITEEQAEEMRNKITTTTPAVTSDDTERIAIPGMVPVATEETAPAVTNRKTQTYTTAATTELEIDGVITTATEKTTVMTTTTELTMPGDIYITTETTTEVATAGVAPIYTEETTTTTEPELAGDIAIDSEFMPYME